MQFLDIFPSHTPCYRIILLNTSINMQTLTRNQRHQAILALLEQGPVPSQEALVQALGTQGLGVNQATLSRDLKSLGAVKGPGGYQLLRGSVRKESPLEEALATWVDSVAVALNQVVLKTPPGGAQPLAVALDGAQLPNLLGTLAGDDTVLCILASEKAAQEWVQEMEDSGL